MIELLSGVLLVVALVVPIVWYLVWETEGVYLGWRAVIWLYDVYASRYDAIVQNDDEADVMYLSAPLLARCEPYGNPRLLDVATGTGRLPLAMCHHPQFEGHVVALDLSAGMLSQAISKVRDEHFEHYVTFMLANGQELPFADDSFDIVTCLEALEFMPNPEFALRELVRVLRAGGVLLITQRLKVWMPSRAWSQQKLHAALSACGVHQIEFEPWQYDYNKVWARKVGQSEFIGASPDLVSH